MTNAGIVRSKRATRHEVTVRRDVNGATVVRLESVEDPRGRHCRGTTAAFVKKYPRCDKTDVAADFSKDDFASREKPRPKFLLEKSREKAGIAKHMHDVRHSPWRVYATRTFRGTMLATIVTPTSRAHPRGARAPRATAARGAFGDARVLSARDDVGAGLKRSRRRRVRVRALFDPDTVEDPLVRQAMKEPVAFFGGMFAGFLGLSVDDEASPLRKWVRDTSEAAGISRAPAEDDADAETSIAETASDEEETRRPTAALSEAGERESVRDEGPEAV
jgi:hypothetical protein